MSNHNQFQIRRLVRSKYDNTDDWKKSNEKNMKKRSDVIEGGLIVTERDLIVTQIGLIVLGAQRCLPPDEHEAFPKDSEASSRTMRQHNYIL